MDEQFERLLALEAISGFEDPVREYLIEQTAGYGQQQVDAMGNLTVTVGEGEPSLLIVAHMDEVGMLITGTTPDGYLHFQKIGTIDDQLLPGRVVTVHTTAGARPGVIGSRPPHLGGSKNASVENLVIDVGAASSDEAKSLGFGVLQPVTFRKEIRELGPNRVNCRGLDDRAGCYVVLKALEHAAKSSATGRVTFAWSVQEEVGLRGAAALAQSAKYDFVAPVDAFATTDAPDHPRHIAYVPLGKGPVLRMVDHGAIASRIFGRALVDLARHHSIPLQVGATGGETDGKPLQEAGGHMVPIALPMRYLHSLAETADMRDIRNAIRLIGKLLDELSNLKELK